MAKEDQTAGDKPAEDEEFVALEVDGSGKPLNQEAHEEPDDEEEDDDERAGHAEGDEEDEVQLASETPEDRKERRRREKRAQRIRQRRAAELKDRQIGDLLTANNTLVERVARLEGRSVQYDINSLEGNLAKINEQLDQAKDTMAACVKAADGDGVAEVTEIQYGLRDQKRQIQLMIQRAKSQNKDGGQQPAQQGQQPRQDTRQAAAPAPQMDPAAVTRAVGWAGKHKAWYDPSGSNQDSVRVIEIDNAIMAEGYDPTSDEYWDELSSRVKEELPHRFKRTAKTGGSKVVDDQGEKPAERKPGGPRMAAASQSNDPGRPLRKNEVRVTPERRKAMEAAGMWEDPAKRNRMLASYAKYDRENA